MSWNNWLKRLWNPSRASGSVPAAGGRTGSRSDALGVGPPVRLRIRVGAVTTVGNYREHNEDNFFIPGLGTLAVMPEGLPSAIEWTLPPPAEPAGAVDNGHRRPASPPPARPEFVGPFIVADGMGGQLAGEQASKIAVEIIPKEVAQRLGSGEDEAAAIRGAIASANREIIAHAHVVPECSNMGTTVVLALLRPGRVAIAGIGDSRAYRLRGGSLERMTRDHDLATALISAGTIRPEEAERHQFRHVLYLYLGSPEARDGPEDVRVDELRSGDRYLLVSDGLTGVVSDEALAQTLQQHDDPQQAARELVRLALRNDSRDNVTCLIISADGLPDEPPSDRAVDRRS
ncbi:PP2C family protein-serine/threonine phosphatase [Tautonia plasticadhaerens]|uniref:Serine/threonine phosphatase stp n=1 Tax=Tautonia plasticadhaerens TaxID=2527974 RepID=A0A518H8U8_9BACT|nr:protein phosphatase 2C domain-containing protein [Tautonia plasticadhaerens]QDV37196.1 Serine/threonine phosphatase stp [Tautonia plasticadhaerens]